MIELEAKGIISLGFDVDKPNHLKKEVDYGTKTRFI